MPPSPPRPSASRHQESPPVSTILTLPPLPRRPPPERFCQIDVPHSTSLFRPRKSPISSGIPTRPPYLSPSKTKLFDLAMAHLESALRHGIPPPEGGLQESSPGSGLPSPSSSNVSSIGVSSEFKLQENLTSRPRRKPRFKLRESLTPFIPYVDKPSETSTTKGPGTSSAVQLDECWINLLSIRKWLKTCDKSHESHCWSAEEISRTESQGPAWLIDVRRSCLVQVQDHNPYFALSYVWGQTTSTAATTQNIQDLQKENALDSESVILPKTVEDTIGLVRLLHGQYLWVDRLCIIQDGPEKEAQLNQMATIYSLSYATIIAAQGSDATHGLRGIRQVTGPRNISSFQETKIPLPEDTVESMLDEGFADELEYDSSEFEIDDDSQSGDSHSDEEKGGQRSEDYIENRNILGEQARMLMETKWYERAWTFQEQLFSRRKIVFQNQTVNWECHCVAWHEGQSLLEIQFYQPCNKRPSYESNGFNKTPWPDTYRYARLVALYNLRHLTYPEDVIDAFTGVILDLSPAFHGGFISGLPQMFFDCALLWQPYRELTRRESVKRPKEEACLPSWSWLGWQGELDSHSWRSAYEYMRKNPDEHDEYNRRIWRKCSWSTTSTVKWYYIDEIGKKTVINTSGHCYRNSSSDVSLVLPPGWTRGICPDSGEPFFRHDCDPTQEFWYPIPLCFPNPVNFQPVNARLISCRTKRAFVRLGSKFHTSEVSECQHVTIFDGQRDEIGVLRLQFGQLDSQDELVGINHELIELSAGSVLNPLYENAPFDELRCMDCPFISETYEFYNVMWIERKKGIAYRKSIGRVIKTAWEAIALEDIDITLG
jgi:Heterokaryon incompatibility protein (HET)